MSYEATIRKLRLPLGFLLGIAYVAFAPRYVTPLKLVVGATIALAGVVVRGWAAGHIVKYQRLATTGPYAHTRNPLYFGSFLIAAGFAIAAHPALLLLVIAFWVAVYGPTIERERQTVSAKFPDEYSTWAENVPPFVPRPTPYRSAAAGADDAESGRFSFALFMRHGEWKALLTYAIAVAWLAWHVSRRA